MALVDYVSPEDAEGRAREILETYEQDHGESALFNEALAHSAQVLDARFEYGTRLLEEGTVARDIKEFVFVVVSEANQCEYCLDDHRGVLVERFGADEEEIEVIAAGEFERLPDRKQAIAAFADQVARDPKRVGETHLQALYDAGYTDEGVIELLAAATLAVSANAIVDALSIHPTDR